MAFNGNFAFTYPTSKLLGARPCGITPTSQAWIDYGANPNIPVYNNAPNENCDRQGSCTPNLRFKDGNNDLAISRKELRQANNRLLALDNSGVGVTPITLSITKITAFAQGSAALGSQTPFRALMNGGDPNVSVNKYPSTLASLHTNLPAAADIYAGAPNQVSSTKRASNSSAVRMGGAMPTQIFSTQDAPEGGGQVALWSGNSKWVYDGSDYVKFKKLQAKNRNFNDNTWGGDRNNASQVALGRVRH